MLYWNTVTIYHIKELGLTHLLRCQPKKLDFAVLNITVFGTIGQGFNPGQRMHSVRVSTKHYTSLEVSCWGTTTNWKEVCLKQGIHGLDELAADSMTADIYATHGNYRIAENKHPQWLRSTWQLSAITQIEHRYDWSWSSRGYCTAFSMSSMDMMRQPW